MNINTSTEDDAPTSKVDTPSSNNNEDSISSPTDIKPTLSTQLNNATTPTSKRYVQMINDASGPLDDILDSIMITPKNNSNSVVGIVGMQQVVGGVGEEKGDDIIEDIVNVDSEELDDNWPLHSTQPSATTSINNTPPTKLSNNTIATPKSSNKMQPPSTISTINTTSNTAISDNNMNINNNTMMNISPTETEFSQVFKGTSLIDATSKVVIH